MGVVLRARDVRDQRPAALKLLLRGRDASQTQQRRFARECELIRQLQHPGLIRLLDHGQERGLEARVVVGSEYVASYDAAFWRWD